MTRNATRAVVLAMAMAVVAASASAQGATTPHSPADTRFMQGMLHHHAQAVAMAALVPTRTSRADLKLLAQRIDVSQVDEMELMRQWLRDRRETVPDVTPAADAHAGHTLMPGMLSPAQMAELSSASGAEFDRRFLAGMIQHHEGALVMVAALFATPGAGQETAIFSFASDVDSDQRAEIARMRTLLATMRGASREGDSSTRAPTRRP